MKRYFPYLFLVLCCFGCTGSTIEETKVAIQPIGTVSEYQVQAVSMAIEDVYGLKTEVLEPIPFPKHTEVNIKSPRHRADKLIAFLKKEKADSMDYILGLTMGDISTTKKNVKDSSHKYFDWGVFGLGYRPGVSSIVSSYRLGKDIPAAVIVMRLSKVAVHELGHNLGLKHCKSDEECVMKDAVERIQTVDNAPLDLCSACRREIGLEKDTISVP